MNHPTRPKTFRIYYPLNKLKPTPQYTSPTNTDTIWEYYLLENLSCGLVRDDQFSEDGYRGGLAESWRKTDGFTWKFKLRKDLKFSDGSAISTQDIYEYYLNFFKNEESRHLKLLNKFKELKLVNNELIFVFDEPTDAAVLHELSLADAVFSPSLENESYLWSRTVGPYYIDYTVSTGQSLILKANHFSPFYHPNMPQTIDLFQLVDSSLINQLFTDTYATDFFLVPPQADRKILKQLIANGAIHEPFLKTNIFYFYFPNGSIAITDDNLRHAFSQSVATVKRIAHWVVDGSTEVWDQMIPPDFPGLIDLGIIKTKLAMTIAPADELLIWVRVPIENLSEDFLPLLEKNLVQSGVTKKVHYYMKKPDGPYFSAITGFVGNQQDPMGSWSYLIGSKHSPLGAFEYLYADDFHSQTHNSVQPKDRIAVSKDIQCKVLTNNHAVPVVLGSFHALHSNRLDISRLNRFDNRVRMYELRGK